MLSERSHCNSVGVDVTQSQGVQFSHTCGLNGKGLMALEAGMTEQCCFSSKEFGANKPYSEPVLRMTGQDKMKMGF